MRGKRRACAITGRLPCRRTQGGCSMSEYRPGMTSPHTTTAYRTLFAPRPPSVPLPALVPRPTRSSTTPPRRTTNVVLLRVYPLVALCVHWISLCRTSTTSSHVHPRLSLPRSFLSAFLSSEPPCVLVLSSRLHVDVPWSLCLRSPRCSLIF